jgi:hypothetical protein
MRRDRLRPLNLQICQFNVGLGDYLWTPWGGVLRRNPSQDEDTGDDYLQVLSESVLPSTYGPKKKTRKNPSQSQVGLRMTRSNPDQLKFRNFEKF